MAITTAHFQVAVEYANYCSVSHYWAGTTRLREMNVYEAEKWSSERGEINDVLPLPAHPENSLYASKFLPRVLSSRV